MGPILKGATMWGGSRGRRWLAGLLSVDSRICGARSYEPAAQCEMQGSGGGSSDA